MVGFEVTGSGGAHGGREADEAVAWPEGSRDSRVMRASACSFETKGDMGRVLLCLVLGMPLAEARLVAIELERSLALARLGRGRRGGCPAVPGASVLARPSVEAGAASALRSWADVADAAGFECASFNM